MPTRGPPDLRIYLSDGLRLFARTSWRPCFDTRETVADMAT